MVSLTSGNHVASTRTAPGPLHRWLNAIAVHHVISTG